MRCIWGRPSRSAPTLVTVHSGIVHMAIHTYGITGHIGRLEGTVNAVHKMTAVVDALRHVTFRHTPRPDLPAFPRLNVGSIIGGRGHDYVLVEPPYIPESIDGTKAQLRNSRSQHHPAPPSCPFLPPVQRGTTGVSPEFLPERSVGPEGHPPPRRQRTGPGDRRVSVWQDGHRTPAHLLAGIGHEPPPRAAIDQCRGEASATEAMGYDGAPGWPHSKRMLPT
jgi:Peptidase dimerisation domain